MIIREAIKEDKEGLEILLSEAYGETYIKGFNDLLQKRKDSGIYTFVGILDKRVVATYSVIIETKFIHNGGIVGHLEDFAVLKKYRGKDIGQKMIDYIMEFCLQKGCYKVVHLCDIDLVPYYEKKSKMYTHAAGMRRDFK